MLGKGGVRVADLLGTAGNDLLDTCAATVVVCHELV